MNEPIQERAPKPPGLLPKHVQPCNCGFGGSPTQAYFWLEWGCPSVQARFAESLVTVELLEVVRRWCSGQIRVYGSWLNQNEIDLGLFLRVMPRQNEESLLSKILRRKTDGWNRRMNRNWVTINWKFTRTAARPQKAIKDNLSRRHRRG